MLTAMAIVGVVALTWYAVQRSEGSAAAAAEPQIGHVVFFTLKDNSAAARQQLVDACNKYLDKHPGTIYYSAGVRVEDLKRDVNDQDFDVALHLIFANRAAHDKYQDDPRHLKFIEENRANWKKVRVFDSAIAK